MTLPLLEIHAKDNNKIKHLRGLCEQASYRKKQQQTVLEGIHLIDAYLKSKNLDTKSSENSQLSVTKPIEAIYLTTHTLENIEAQQLLNSSPNTPVYVLADNLYQDVRTLGPGVDMMAVINTPQLSTPIHQHQDMLILDNLQDPGNVGTLLRTAAAAGIQQIVCSTGTAAIWSPRVLRAGMGAQFSLNIFEHVDLAQLLNEITLPVNATSSHASSTLYHLNLKQPCVWLMGNEGQGVSPTLLSKAHGIAIPQPGGQESLNVAVAGAVCMFEMVRQRINH